MCVETYRIGLVFSETVNLMNHLPRFTLKIECFPIYFLGNPINVFWNAQNKAQFLEVIDLQSHMPMFTLKWMFSHLSSWKPNKYVLKPSEQGSIFRGDWFAESHAYVYSKNECFSIYLLGNWINVCWNCQNMAQFSKKIDLRGHMPRFTLKLNVSLSIF